MLKTILITGLFAATSALFSGCQSSPSANAATADDNSLGAPIGTKIANAPIETVQGKRTDLSTAFNGTTTIVTFYRGGWCPYCNTALAEWNENLSQIESRGAQFIAISTEKPSDAYRTQDKGGLAFDIYVDDKLAASRAFDVLFRVDDKTQDLYQNKYNLNVAAFNASNTWDLPHPGTFIVDRNGVVRYAHVSDDYRSGRADPQAVIAALDDIN